jgi:pimeloyl-ACP methyl ester carboxylesterase
MLGVMAARILLVPGIWLGAWAWDEVAGDLRRHGDDVFPLTLPGRDPADPDRLNATLETQAQAIVAAAAEPSVLVAHSGGAAPAYLATDLAPERFSRTIYVDTGPLPAGFVMVPGLSSRAREFRLPDWPELAASGNSLAGLDAAALQRFRDRAVSEPIGIVARPLRLGAAPDRRKIPATVICSSFGAALVRQLVATGEEPMFAELAHIDADYIDLPTGHWPMWSRPAELAEILHAVANR